MNLAQDPRIDAAKNRARQHSHAQAWQLTTPGNWLVRSDTKSQDGNTLWHHLEVTLDGRPIRCPCQAWTPYCWHFGKVRLSMERRLAASSHSPKRAA